MQLNGISDYPGIQTTQFNPISNYNNFLKGQASFNTQNNFQFDFEKALQKEMNEPYENPNRVFDNMSPVDSLANSIGKAFNGGLNQVNDLKKESENLEEAFARGEDVSVHDLMIAAEKSSLSMQMAMQIRNKMIAAYTDLKNVSL